MSNDDVPPTSAGGTAIGGSFDMSGGEFTGRDRITGMTPQEHKEILEVVLKYFPKTWHDPASLDRILGQFHDLNERLNEWKGLHNGFDRLLSAHGQYFEKVEKYYIESAVPDLTSLKLGWRAVCRSTDTLVEYAAATHTLEPQFKTLPDGRQTRFRQVVQIAVQCKDITSQLEDELSRHLASGSLVNQLFRITPDVIRKWNERHYYLTKDLGSSVIESMSWADENLRAAATELYALSRAMGN